ncbi:MAG: ATP-binding cassette domain-containing protein [Candidatus Azobacteroides sp.]|nr:ATP-binding cassette domain-containing protein [Candidatus Azobacteroides sp.]
MNELLVDVKNISAGYEGKIVLRDASLSVYEQDFIGIIGPNGGGKTTFVKVILGLIKPVSGSVQFARKELKMRIGYMPQTNSIDRKFPILVSEVIASGVGRERNISKMQKQERICEIIEEMGIEAIRNAPIGELSGGQLQRTLLARALVNKPELLILDEPDSYIDKRFELHFYELLQKINRKTAIILISHDIGMVISTVKNIAYINETLQYHSGSDIDNRWLEEHFKYPFDRIGQDDILQGY